MSPARCICCPGKAQHLHHAVYAQEVRREHGSLTDPRNLVPVRMRCHAAHHDRSRPFELSMLPDSVFDFAAELLGAGPAYEYLSRRYRGGDDRLDALLIRHENEEISHGRAA